MLFSLLNIDCHSGALPGQFSSCYSLRFMQTEIFCDMLLYEVQVIARQVEPKSDTCWQQKFNLPSNFLNAFIIKYGAWLSSVSIFSVQCSSCRSKFCITPIQVFCYVLHICKHKLYQLKIRVFVNKTQRFCDFSSKSFQCQRISGRQNLLRFFIVSKQG